MRFCVTLTESFDRPLPWEWLTETTAEFTLESKDARWDGMPYEVTFGRDNPIRRPGMWWLAFGPPDRQDKFALLSLDDQTLTMRVLFTVVTIARDFLDRHPDATSLEFSAEGASRIGAYRRLVQRFLPPSWTFEVRPTFYGDTIFVITRATTGPNK